MFFTFFSSSKQDNSSSKSKANRAAISYCMFTKTEGNAHAQSITIICTQLFAGKLLTNQNLFIYLFINFAVTYITIFGRDTTTA